MHEASPRIALRKPSGDARAEVVLLDYGRASSPRYGTSILWHGANLQSPAMYPSFDAALQDFDRRR